MDTIFIKDLEGLSVRAYNALINSGITTISQLRELSNKDLLSIKGLGKKSLQELRITFPDPTTPHIKNVNHQFSHVVDYINAIEYALHE